MVDDDDELAKQNVSKRSTYMGGLAMVMKCCSQSTITPSLE